jgi:hypothetical protein
VDDGWELAEFADEEAVEGCKLPGLRTVCESTLMSDVGCGYRRKVFVKRKIPRPGLCVL